MNFLAHMLLTYPDVELTIGNFIADFVRNRDLIMFSDRVVKGVHLHRFIDHYTDNHPVVLESTRVLRERHGKYAPVVIDVYYDFVLSANWTKFSNISVREFSDDVYRIINSQSDFYPEHLQKLTPRLIADDFLLQYGRPDGLKKTFGHIARRAKFDSNIASAYDDLVEHYDMIAAGFLKFFPDLISEVNTRIV